MGKEVNFFYLITFLLLKFQITWVNEILLLSKYMFISKAGKRASYFMFCSWQSIWWLSHFCLNGLVSFQFVFESHLCKQSWPQNSKPDLSPLGPLPILPELQAEDTKEKVLCHISSDSTKIPVFQTLSLSSVKESRVSDSSVPLTLTQSQCILNQPMSVILTAFKNYMRISVFVTVTVSAQFWASWCLSLLQSLY